MFHLLADGLEVGGVGGGDDDDDGHDDRDDDSHQDDDELDVDGGTWSRPRSAKKAANDVFY